MPARTSQRITRQRTYLRAVIEINPWCAKESTQNLVEQALLKLNDVVDVHLVASYKKSDYAPFRRRP